MRIIEILDILQLIFWSGTYLLILYYGFRYRESQPQMPYVAGTNNLAWELAVVIKSGGFEIQLIWLVLDAFIWVQNGKRLKDAERRRNIYIYIYISGGVISFAIMWIAHHWASGMLISSFLIDLTMAIEYVIRAKKIALKGRTPIALAKLLGDLFAWLAYMQQSPFVAVTGFAVLLLNIFYLALCLEQEAKGRRKEKR